jgi:MFS family permease
MSGVGDNYIAAFAIFMKALPIQTGMISTLPPLIGSLSQLVALRFMEVCRSRRDLIRNSVVLQACTWLPVVLIALLCEPSPHVVWLLIACMSFYHIFGNLSAPVWNSLIGDLVPAKERGAFFGYRNQRSGITMLLSLLFSGAVLNWSRELDYPHIGFAVLFTVALVARLLSGWFISRHDDPPFVFDSAEQFTFWQFIKRAPHSNFVKFVLFVSTFNFAVAISGPFYTLYMLRDLGLGYLEFTGLTATTVITQFLTMQHWGRLSDQFGNKKLMDLSAAGLASIPFLWLVSAEYWFIVIIQTYSGFFWAGYNLSTASFMFDAVTPQKRARCVAYQATINASLVLAGSLIGGWLLSVIPDSAPLGSGISTPPSDCFRLFFLSGVARCVVLYIFLPLFKEVREVELIRHRDLVFRAAAIRPISGMTVAVVNGEDEAPSS